MGIQISKDEVTALFADMEKNLRLFKRESYKENFQAYQEKHHTFFKNITGFLRENEAHEDRTQMYEIGEMIAGAAVEVMKASGPKIKKESVQLNLNMMAVVYIVPAVRGLKERRAEELSEVICEEWNRAFTGVHIQASDFQGIQDGFKTKLCYVTTAVCRSLDKPENCYELNLLKKYRDDYLAHEEGGMELIHKYYDIAPTIVKRIGKSAEAEEIYLYIWENYLKPCVELIEAGANEECRALYVKMVQELHREYMEEYDG